MVSGMFTWCSVRLVSCYGQFHPPMFYDRVLCDVAFPELREGDACFLVAKNLFFFRVYHCIRFRIIGFNFIEHYYWPLGSVPGNFLYN